MKVEDVHAQIANLHCKTPDQDTLTVVLKCIFCI